MVLQLSYTIYLFENEYLILLLRVTIKILTKVMRKEQLRDSLFCFMNYTQYFFGSGEIVRG